MFLRLLWATFASSGLERGRSSHSSPPPSRAPSPAPCGEAWEAGEHYELDTVALITAVAKILEGGRLGGGTNIGGRRTCAALPLASACPPCPATPRRRPTCLLTHEPLGGRSFLRQACHCPREGRLCLAPLMPHASKHRKTYFAAHSSRCCTLRAAAFIKDKRKTTLFHQQKSMYLIGHSAPLPLLHPHLPKSLAASACPAIPSSSSAPLLPLPRRSRLLHSLFYSGPRISTAPCPRFAGLRVGPRAWAVPTRAFLLATSRGDHLTRLAHGLELSHAGISPRATSAIFAHGAPLRARDLTSLYPLCPLSLALLPTLPMDLV